MDGMKKRSSDRRLKRLRPQAFLRSVDPTFAATARIWLFLRELYVRRAAWAVRDAAAELEVHPKTILRYVRFLAIVHTDGDGEPIVTLERRGRSPFVVLVQRILPFEADLEGGAPRARARLAFSRRGAGGVSRDPASRRFLLQCPACSPSSPPPWPS